MSFLLSAIAIIAAVGLCVMLALTEDASRRETKRLMRDLGFNLRVIPKETDMAFFYRTGYSDKTMYDSALGTLAQVKNVSYNHLIAVLQGQIQLQGQEVLIMGITDEKAPPGQKKPPMIKASQVGDIQVGAEIANRLNLKKGDTLEINGRQFQVSRRMPEMGTIDDVQIVGSLADVQQILGLESQINEIKALDCLCLTPAENPQAILQAEIERTLPDARVVMLSTIAEARARQRQMSDQHAQFVMAGVILIAAAWVGVMAVINVRQRSSEIGLLKALGYGSSTIASLILGRAVLIGVIAAIIGTAIGMWVAVAYGPTIFQVTAKNIQMQPQLFGYALLITPLFAAVASLIPAALAVMQDPAQVLRRQ